MTILFYDTETTGLPDFRARSHDPKQPHLVEIALLVCDDDGTELRHWCHLVRPDGWVITEENTKNHNITHEQAMAEGIPEDMAVALWLLARTQAEIRVAHNNAFDDRILRIAMTRAGVARNIVEFLESQPSFDTCRASTKLVNLPPTEKMLAAGMTTPKAPKLEEAYRFFFNAPMEGAHRALTDVRACAKIYFHLKSLVAEPPLLIEGGFNGGLQEPAGAVPARLG